MAILPLACLALAKAAARGTMREMPGLKRFVPGYADTIAEWVLKRTG